MVRNKRAAPAPPLGGPGSAPPPPPPVRAPPPRRAHNPRKRPAPPPPAPPPVPPPAPPRLIPRARLSVAPPAAARPVTMPASVTQKPTMTSAGPKMAAPGRSYFFGELEQHVTSSLSTDGGSQASDGSSTDVGVCLDDSASDISQDSLATSDSAVSSPAARRQELRSPGRRPDSKLESPPSRESEESGLDSFALRQRARSESGCDSTPTQSPRESSESEADSIPLRELSLRESSASPARTRQRVTFELDTVTLRQRVPSPSLRQRQPSSTLSTPPTLAAAPFEPPRRHSALLAAPEEGFHFHLNEGDEETPAELTEEDSFAGLRDFSVQPDATIRSGRGTVRGVKNRVRAGIATFLQENTLAKGFKERERGRLVLYITTMGIVRGTYQKCLHVRQILRTLMVQFEERDLFLSSANQQELRERLGTDQLQLPQLFLEGQLLGGGEMVERLNETGELRRMLKPYKTTSLASSCQKCGGFRMLPCTACNGSKKSCHRNYFTAEWVILRCCACDESGLIVCDRCRS